MNENAFVVAGVFLALLMSSTTAAVAVAIHEVVNHFNVVLYIELAQSSFAQIFRDCGHAVALLYRETSDRQIRPIKADQRNVGAMERGDKWQPLAFRLCGKHLASE